MRDHGFKPYSGPINGTREDYGASAIAGLPGSGRLGELEKDVAEGNLGSRGTGNPVLDAQILEELQKQVELLQGYPTIVDFLPSGGGVPRTGRGPLKLPGVRPAVPSLPTVKPTLPAAPPVISSPPTSIRPGTPPPPGVDRSPSGGTMPNSRYAGQTKKLDGPLGEKYPQGVRFTDKGYPDFSPYAKETVTLPNGFGPNRPADDRAAEKIIQERLGDPNWRTPPDYTWHHSEDGKTLQLVPTDLHNGVGHVGGVALKPR